MYRAQLTTYGLWFPVYTREVEIPAGLSLQEIAESEAEALRSQLSQDDGEGVVGAIVSIEDECYGWTELSVLPDPVEPVRLPIESRPSLPPFDLLQNILLPSHPLVL